MTRLGKKQYEYIGKVKLVSRPHLSHQGSFVCLTEFPDNAFLLKKSDLLKVLTDEGNTFALYSRK